MAAGRGAVVAEMTDIRRDIVVERAAADAVLRIGRVLQRWARNRRIVDTEDDCPRPFSCEVADLGIVAVEGERRVAGQAVYGPAPALRDMFELPVTIELVAEEVREAHAVRPHALDDFRKRGLVD